MDEARKWTDEHLTEMENHLRRIYAQNYAEISAKWTKYMASGQSHLNTLYSAYVSAPPDKKADALKRYQDAAQSYTLRNRWYHNMVEDTAYKLAHVNEIAISYINGEMPDIYLRNFNYVDPQVADVGINWTIRDEHMIRNLVEDTLPSKELNAPKDIAWNKRQINSSVLQGILQGENIDKITDRLLPIVGNNRKAAVRTARTMVTGAENRGRQDRYEEYESEGVIMAKVWIATPDNRVRDWHLSMDGQEADVDGFFTDGLGNHLEFPGDPMAPPNTTYNCRCTMGSHLIGLRGKDGSVTHFGNFTSNTLHAGQIKAERDSRR